MNENKSKRKIVMDSFDDLENSRKSILEFCSDHSKIEEEIDILEMAILEACHNAVRHGSKRKNKSVCELKLIYDNQSIKAIVKSYGKAYEVLEKDKFSIEQDFLQFSNGSLGIPLIKSLMDSVEYFRLSNNMNKLIMVKNLTKKQ